MIRALSLAVCLIIAAQVFALPGDCPGCLTASELAAEAPDEDFTDTGVGCSDDCLDPFPDTIEYTLTKG